MENIKVVALDAWETLIENSSEVKARQPYILQPLVEFVGSYGIQFANFNEFRKKYSAAKDTSERLSEEKGVHIGPLERRRFFLGQIGIKLSESNTDMLREVSDEVTRRQQGIYPRLIESDLAKHFEKIKKRGKGIAIVSNLGNVTAAYMRESFEQCGIQQYIDWEFYSDETGLCKPNPKLFELICATTGCKPGNVLFIGDNFAADCEGPQRAGMHTIHIKRKSGIVGGEQPVSVALAGIA